MKKYLLLISIAVFTILSYSSFAQTSTALLGPDVGVSAIISPASTAPTNPTPVPISLEVKNYGTTKSTSFMVFVVIDGSVQPPYLYTDTLSQGGADTVSFGSTTLPSSPVYICAYTVLTGDIDNTNDTSCVMVNSTTGIASSTHSSNNCLIYPQPANESVTVKWKGHQIVSYQLTDLQGRNLISVDRIQSEKFIVDVSLLAPGIYIIQLFDGSQRVKTKLIVRH